MFFSTTAAVIFVVTILIKAAVIVFKYARTRDRGFIWLGIALVVWPVNMALMNYGLQAMITRINAKQPVGFYPFLWVERGQITLGQLLTIYHTSIQLLGAVLVIVALCSLYGKR